MSDINMRILLSASAGNTMSVIGGVSNALGSGGLGLALAGAAVAAVGFGVASVKMAADYQAGMLKVQALTGANTQQMAYYNAQLMQLATNAGVAPVDLTDGLYNVLSASYKGADAVNVLTLATEDAKIGMTSATVTTDALTNVLRSFGVQSQDITRTNGEMLQTVTLGKATFEQYAQSIVKSASSAVQFHVSMEVMNAAWATMTSSGIRAAQASTDFQQSLKVMYGNINTVAKSLEKQGIAFDMTAYNGMDYGHKVEYLNQLLQEANARHIKVTGVTLQAAQAISTIANHIGDYNANLATLSDKQRMAHKTAEAWAITQAGFNQQMDRARAALDVLMIAIGQQLLPVLTPLIGKITSVIGVFGDWVGSGHAVSDTVKWFKDNLQLAIPIVAGLAAMLLVTLVPAVWSLAAGVIAATWPVLAIGAAVALVAAGAVYLYQNFKQVRDAVAATGAAFQAMGAWIAATTMPMLRAIGAFLASQFMPVWHQLVQLWQSQLMPLFGQLGAALQQLKPLFELLGGIIVAVVLVDIGMMVGMLKGTVQAFAGLLSGLIIVIGGIVQMFTGAFQIIGGIVTFFIDLFTGHFNKLLGDLGGIGHGIVNLFSGMWAIIKGIFLAAWYAISGYVSGFVSGIVGFFQGLYNTLVGHSIIPDMINGIVNWFGQLPGRAMAFISSLVSQLTGTLGNLGSMALGWAGDMMHGFVTGIQNGIGAVGNAIAGVADKVRQFLHFSKPDVGPLADVDTWMPDFTDMLSRGLVGGVPKLQTALGQLTTPIAMSLAPGSLAGSLHHGIPTGGGGAHSGGHTFIINVTARPQDEQEMEQVARYAITYFGDAIRGQYGNI